MPQKTLIVTDSHTGKRLDMFIQHHEAYSSRNRIQTFIKEGLALVNGRTEKPGYKIRKLWGLSRIFGLAYLTVLLYPFHRG